MGLWDIRAEHILGAIAVLDDPVEGPRLTKQLNFGPARSYRLLHEGRFYDSKPVVGIAHGLSPAGEYLSGRDFTGGYRGAGEILRRRGFYVDQNLLYEISKLRIDRTHGRPAAYQYVLLLWSIARVRAGLPRMVPFNEVKRELADLLAPFALANTPPDPAMPWVALSRSHLWETELPGDGQPLNESTVRSLNLSAGLTTSMAMEIPGAGSRDILGQDAIRATVDFVATRIGAESAYLPLIERLGLADSVSDIVESSEPPEVVDAVAAIEELISPRRRFGRRFTAAENRAIEMRAVEVVQQHFNDELGFLTEDVGATESYDVHATRDDEVIKVEVKGTTTRGASVVLTRNEVALHRAEHPNNALAIVRDIVLDHSGEKPVAHGGELVLTMPWAIDEEGLSPIAYDYRTGL